MGVLGVADSDPSRRLEADIEFIKTRLDLIARQMASGTLGGVPNLDAKLRSIYESVRSIPSHPATDTKGIDSVKTVLHELSEAAVTQHHESSEAAAMRHKELIEKLEALENRMRTHNEQIAIQNETMGHLKDAIRDLVGYLRNG